MRGRKKLWGEAPPGTKHRRKWDEIQKKRLLWLYYHSPILLLGFSYDAYMMLLSCSYVRHRHCEKKVVGNFFFCIFADGLNRNSNRK